MNSQRNPSRSQASGRGNTIIPLRRSVAVAREAYRSGHIDEALRSIRAAADPGLDYSSAVSLLRLHDQIAKRVTLEGKPLKLAVVGSYTTDQISDLLRYFMIAVGVHADIYQSPYGTFRQEIIDEESGLYDFQPDFVLMATTWRDLRHMPEAGDDSAAAQLKRSSELEEWKHLWIRMHDLIGCQIIQDTFVRPAWSSLGNLEFSHPGGLGGSIQRLNLGFAETAPPFVTLHDADHLAASHGRWQWSDERYFFNAKLHCAPQYLVDYAHSVASLIAAQLGLSKKCLVLDLDNTLWGGVVGDDGVSNLRLGTGDAESEAFTAFQKYVMALKNRGVVLAVCSANEDANARAPFEERPGMVLSLNDISCFVANWNDKATNIQRIAHELNLGLDSFVFVDDDPAQRELVRRILPEVAVPEMPKDPSQYVQVLDRQRYFQITSLGTEDLHRTKSYQENSERESLRVSAESLDEFLESLEMEATIVPVGENELERCVQLINRSNQFNLTTVRRTYAALQDLARDDDWMACAMRLSDRFGDNGIISVLLASEIGEALVIDTWVMSCRVLRRGAERHMFNHIAREARAKGLQKIVGNYIPTKKNRLVEQHYKKLGFQEVRKTSEGASTWEYGLLKKQSTLKTFICETARDA